MMGDGVEEWMGMEMKQDRPLVMATQGFALLFSSLLYMEEIFHNTNFKNMYYI